MTIRRKVISPWARPGADLPRPSEGGAVQEWLARRSAEGRRSVVCLRGKLDLGQEAGRRIVTRNRGAAETGSGTRGNTGRDGERGQTRAPADALRRNLSSAERARAFPQRPVIRFRKHL